MTPKFRVPGLDRDARYKVTEVAPEGKTVWTDGKVLGGDFIASFGFNLNITKPYQSTVLLLERQ